MGLVKKLYYIMQMNGVSKLNLDAWSCNLEITPLPVKANVIKNAHWTCKYLYKSFYMTAGVCFASVLFYFYS